MTINTQAFEKALPVVAGFITDRTGVKVLRGAKACTDSKVIYLPKLPELGLSMRDVIKAIAYIYHECFHILKSNFTLDARKLSPLQQGLVGVLEDIRIEHWGQSNFPAARRYLGKLVEIFTEDGLAGKSPSFPAYSEEDEEATLLQFYILYRLRHDVLKQTVIAPVLEPTAMAVNAKFPRGMMVRLDALIFEVENCDSEDDVFALAEEIAKMIKEEKDKEEEEQQQQNAGAPQGEDDNQSPNSGAPGSEQEEGGQSTPSSAGEEDQKGSGASQPSVSNGEAQDDSAQQGLGSAAGGKGSGDLNKLLDMGVDEIAGTIDEMLEEVLNKTALEHSGRGVSMPNVHKMPLKVSGIDMGKVKASINAVRTKTLQWMSSVAESDVQHSRSGMLLDHSRLFSTRLGGDIFIRTDEGIDLNAAISIVIDRSGSMSSRIQEAASAVVAAMLAFDVPGIETQVSVFPVYGSVSGVQDEGVAVIKRWEESSRNMASRIASLTTSGGTPMAEAILFAASNIIRREETLRIVMVVTDGMPDDLSVTREVIDSARSANITVVGLGIGVDPSSVFGKQYSASLQDVTELSGAMVKLIKASMLH